MQSSQQKQGLKSTEKEEAREMKLGSCENSSLLSFLSQSSKQVASPAVDNVYTFVRIH